MKNSDINDPLFRQAVDMIGEGNIAALEALLTSNPSLIRDRLPYPGGGYFKDPYLAWFMADNPIRVGKLPGNIVAIAKMLIDFIKQVAPATLEEQLGYALELVATGRIPRECGVQIEIIDLLIDNGAKHGGGLGAFANGNIEAGRRLIERGGTLTLPAAVCLDLTDDIPHLTAKADTHEKLVAITAAAFYGKAAMIAFLLKSSAGPNGYPAKNSGFHTHATPLHQAVSSGSLECVKLLVEAGAKLDATDLVYNGTPAGWAMYMAREESSDAGSKQKFEIIADYLNNIK